MKQKFFLKKPIRVFLILFLLFLQTTCALLPKKPNKSEDEQLINLIAISKVIVFYNKNLDKKFIYNLSNCIIEKSRLYKVDEHLILTILAQESRFDPNAKSKLSNAVGLGQIIPRYWKKRFNFEDNDLLNWETNLDVTVKIMKELQQNYGHRSDWIVYYYGVGSPDKDTYYQSWKQKNNKIKKMLSFEFENKGGINGGTELF